MASVPTVSAIRSANSQTAILFVHGFGGDWKKTWGEFPKLVAADKRLNDWDIYSIGYATALLPDIVGIWSANAPLDRLSLLLHAAATQPPLAACKSLVIVAHSMGGLITQRALLDHPDLTKRISHVFLFGTPSAGLSKASPFTFWKRQVRDMAEDGDFIKDVRTRWPSALGAPMPFRFWTVAGDQDEFVPSSSSLTPFPLQQREVVAGNHLTIVKPASDADLGLKIVINGISGDAFPAGPGNAARVAIEARQFAAVIAELEPNAAKGLDPRALVNLALALDGVGRREDAIKVLETHKGKATDPLGALAGRIKRRWLVEHVQADAERTLELYRQGYERSVQNGDPAQAYYHGINVAFMELAYRSDENAAREMAAGCLDHCKKARRDFWCVGTEADAHLILRENGAALNAYKEAVAMNPQPWELRSMYQQALRLADLLRDKKAEDAINAICRGDE